MAKTLIEIRAETSQYQQAMRQAAAEMKNLTAQQSKEASAALLEYQKANHISGTAFTGCGTSKVKRIRAGRPACKSDRTDIEDRCSKGDRAAEWTAV